MPTPQQEIQQALEAYKSGQAVETGLLTPDVQKDWQTSAGFQAYNLTPVALLLFPQLTPFRNALPRTSGKGKKSEYKAVTGINTGGVQGFVAEKTAASTIATATSDITASYRSMALADSVSFEAQWAGQGFTDVKALAVTNLLRAQMIAEENALLFAANSAAASQEQAPGAVGNSAGPTLLAQGAPAGNFAATTYYVVQTVVTGMGESLRTSSAVSVVTTANQSVKITPNPMVGQPVLGYKLYIGTSAGGPFYEVLPANISGGSLSNGVLPGGSTKWYTNGDAVNVTVVPTSANPTPPVSDGTASSLAFNGIYTQMVGGVGATLINQGGALTNTGLTNVFSTMWANAKGDPDVVYANATESIKITNITLGNGTPYFVMVDNTQQATSGYRVARVTNPVTGSEVPVRVHPTLAQGTMLFMSTKLPAWYVPTDVPSTMDMNLVQDYVEIDYPPTQSNPYWQVEVRLFGSPRLFIPALQGALTGINNQ